MNQWLNLLENKDQIVFVYFANLRKVIHQEHTTDIKLNVATLVVFPLRLGTRLTVIINSLIVTGTPLTLQHKKKREWERCTKREIKILSINVQYYILQEKAKIIPSA